MLVRLHTFIRSVLRKNRSAFVPPALITEAINQASYDLWRELIQDFRTTGKQSDLLSAFKASSSPSVGGGVFTVAGKSESVVAGISILDSSSNEYPTRLLTSDSDWVLRKKLPVEDVSESLVKRFSITVNSSNPTLDLPQDFMAHKGAIYTSANRKGKIVPSEEFLEQKHPVDQKQIDFQNINEDLIKSEGISCSGTPSVGDLPSDYLSNTGVFYNAEKREGKILSPQDFLNKKNRVTDIIGLEDTYTVQATINAASGTADLPDNYAANTGSFYSSTGIEGKILKPNQFRNKEFRRIEVEEREEDFLISTTLSSDSGAKPSLPVDYLYNKGVVYSITGNEGKILSPQNFKNKAFRRDEIEEREEDFILSTTLSSASGAKPSLPVDYLYNKGVFYSSGNKEGIILTPENFRNKNIRRAEIEKREEDFLDRIDINYGTSAINLPEDYLYHKKVFYTAAGAEGVILSSTEFSDRKNSVIFPPDADNPIATIYDNKLEILPASTNYVFPYICYFNENNPIATIVNDTIEILPSAAGYVLPYVSYYNADNPIATIVNDTIEILPSAAGYVLPYVSYYNTNNPIATIYDDKIEVLPAADGYKLPYLALYSIDNPIGTINNNQLEVLPNGTFNYTLPYIAKYTAENPIATIFDNKISVLPLSTTLDPISYVLPYVAHATERLGYSRAFKSGTSLKFEIDPTPSNAKVYYIDPPSTAAGNPGYTDGVVAITATTDLDWDEAAFSSIASRALLYIGSSINDNDATKIESQVNRNESDIVPRRGRSNQRN